MLEKNPGKKLNTTPTHTKITNKKKTKKCYNKFSSKTQQKKKKKREFCNSTSYLAFYSHNILLR